MVRFCKGIKKFSSRELYIFLYLADRAALYFTDILILALRKGNDQLGAHVELLKDQLDNFFKFNH
jgi:hypothetical protein